MSKSVLSGDLAFLNLAEVLQVAGNCAGTGQLILHSKYLEKSASIFISEGAIVDAECGQKRGEEAVLALFGWIEGDFEFIEKPVTCEKKIRTSPMKLIMEAAHKLDEGKIERVGAVSYEKKKAEGDHHIPVVKGPRINYLNVIGEDHFNTGENIFVEGSFGRWGWVILEGTVEITKKTGKGDIPVIRLGPGSFLGPSVFLSGEILRACTSVAASAVHLGVLDQEALFREISGVSRELQRMGESHVARFDALVQRLASIYAGDQLDTGFENGEVLIPQGKQDCGLHRIVSGRGFLARSTGKKTMPLFNVSQNDYVGRHPFGREVLEPESAAVILSAGATTQKVDTDAVFREYGQLSQTVRNMHDNAASCIAVLAQLICDRLMKHP